CLVGIALACAGLLAARLAVAEEIGAELAASLTASQRATLIAYRKARGQFERQHRAYWRSITSKRDARRAKRLLGQGYTADDYVADYPPKYTGPELPAD